MLYLKTKLRLKQLLRFISFSHKGSKYLRLLMNPKLSSQIQSVDRALSILEYLADSGESSVTDIAVKLNIHKSTAFRLLATLEKRGFVMQEAERGKYRLGFNLLHLASSITADLDLIKIAKPFCKSLSEKTQETVNLGVLENDSVLNIDQVIGSSNIVSHNWVGHKNPLNCTSTGKAIMAFLPSNEQAKYLKTLTSCTKHSHTDAVDLSIELQGIQKQGYAYTIEELELGLNAVAAPIFNQATRVIAALSVSGPSYRLTQDKLKSLGELTQATAQGISEQLGYKV